MIPDTAEHLLSFVEPEPNNKALAEDLLAPELLRNNSPATWLNWAVAEGLLICKQLNLQNAQGQQIPMAIVWYRIEGAKLIITMIRSITDVPSVGKTWYESPFFTRAFEELGRRHGCNILEAKTRRVGVVASLKPLGWLVESVNLHKKIS